MGTYGSFMKEGRGLSEVHSTRPSRRELRLAREAQVRDSRVEHRDDDSTQVLNTVEFHDADPQAPHTPGTASARSSLQARLRRRAAQHPVVAATVGIVAAASAGYGVVFGGLHDASAAQGPSALATTSIASPSAAVPDSLKKTDSAADSARYHGFERASGGAIARCELRDGANSLVSAFAKKENLVVMPVAEGSYRLTSPFGWRVDPISRLSSMHAGQDFAAPLGTPIYAMADGEVVYSGAGIEGRSSNVVVIAHEINGEKYQTWYVHMYDAGVHVKKGDRVKAGQHIADVGSQGWSTGPHLHFEIHKGHDIHSQNWDDVLDPMVKLAELGAVDISKLC